MKVIIAGSRTFNDYDLLKKICGEQINHLEDEIVSGGAKGADRLGERYAQENNLLLTQFIPEWDKHGKKAGYIRNEEMAKYSDKLIAFWDGASKGTQHMINLAQKHSIKITIIKI